MYHVDIQGNCNIHELIVNNEADVKIVGKGVVKICCYEQTRISKEIFGTGNLISQQYKL